MNASATGRLGWYVNRLQAMGPREIIWRIRNSAQDALLTQFPFLIQPLLGAKPVGQFQHKSQGWLKNTPTLRSPNWILETARAQAVGAFTLFDTQYQLGEINWNCDPASGYVHQLNYGPALNLRDPVKIGSIKHLWELNRHTCVTTAAQAYRLTGDFAHLASLRRHVESWIVQCPTGYGPNWHSALEVALRLIHWAMAWHLLNINHTRVTTGPQNEVFDQAFLSLWEQSARDHLSFINKNLSIGSSANNHLTGELAGIFVATITWDAWPESTQLSETSKQALENAITQQLLPDGVGAEQAFWYAYEIIEVMLFCMVLGRANEVTFGKAVQSRIQQGIDFLINVTTIAGTPTVGDADDAQPIGLNPTQTRDPYPELFACWALWSNRAPSITCDKARWLFDEPASAPLIKPSKRKASPYVQWYPEGGYLVARHSQQNQLLESHDTHTETVLIADAGPLGYLSIAAHGHADALSVNLKLFGVDFLVDPGTFSYRPNDHWRDWFRSTRAHNTVTIDNQDQSENTGPFMWAKHAQSTLESLQCEPGLVWIASHNGYERLTDPVKHQRAINWLFKQNSISITDSFECIEQHAYQWTWQLAAGWQCWHDGGHTVFASKANCKATLEFPHDLAIRIVCGEESPDGGWVSNRLGKKTPAHRIEASTQRGGSFLARTTIKFHQE
jgi:hypothetical protein